MPTECFKWAECYFYSNAVLNYIFIDIQGLWELLNVLMCVSCGIIK